MLKFIIIVLLCNCTSMQNYFGNRINDLTDIPILGLEENVYGASFHFWCIGGGIQSVINASGTGLRNGHFGNYNLTSQKRINFSKIKIPSGLNFILLNSYGHHTKESSERSKKKNFRFASIFFFPNVNECNAPVGFEFSMGMYLGFRVGINFSEIGDFILGIFTADFKNDDFEPKEKIDFTEEDVNQYENREMDIVEKKELEELRKISEETAKAKRMNSEE